MQNLLFLQNQKAVAQGGPDANTLILGNPFCVAHGISNKTVSLDNIDSSNITIKKDEVFTMTISGNEGEPGSGMSRSTISKGPLGLVTCTERITYSRNIPI
jgi:hypothetical protein